MNNIEKYIKSLEFKNRIRGKSILYLNEIKSFCNRNINILDNLPSTGQFEQMKLIHEPEDLVEYIKHQSEKSTSKRWKTIVIYKKQEEVLNIMFYKFLMIKIHEIYQKYTQENSEKINNHESGNKECKLMVNYYIEYLLDNIKMCRKGNE